MTNKKKEDWHNYYKKQKVKTKKKEEMIKEKNKNWTKADEIGAFGGLIITSIIFAIGNFGFILGLLIAYGSYWIIKKIVQSFLKEEGNFQESIVKKDDNLDQQKRSKELKKIEQTKSRKLLIWTGVIIVVLIFISVLLKLNNEDVKLVQTDKSAEYSELIDNMYRNTKYNFRIKFPKNWKIGVGDGLHIVQKASSENSTISVMVQQVDSSGFEGFSSIKDIGTTKEFVNTVIDSVKEKFSDVKVIDYGETKIDNEPAYWLEYSANSQILDNQLKMTNILYYIAKGNTMYSISAGTATDEYQDMKPIFTQTVGTFVLEDY